MQLEENRATLGVTPNGTTETREFLETGVQIKLSHPGLRGGVSPWLFLGHLGQQRQGSCHPKPCGRAEVRLQATSITRYRRGDKPEHLPASVVSSLDNTGDNATDFSTGHSTEGSRAYKHTADSSAVPPFSLFLFFLLLPHSLAAHLCHPPLHHLWDLEGLLRARQHPEQCGLGTH